jgi:hypothetical protein
MIGEPLAGQLGDPLWSQTAWGGNRNGGKRPRETDGEGRSPLPVWPPTPKGQPGTLPALYQRLAIILED